jgi:hypothetical protein
MAPHIQMNPGSSPVVQQPQQHAAVPPPGANMQQIGPGAAASVGQHGGFPYQGAQQPERMTATAASAAAAAAVAAAASGAPLIACGLLLTAYSTAHLRKALV